MGSHRKHVLTVLLLLLSSLLFSQTKVVSLSPSITEILFAVGAGEQVAGVTSYCNYPEAALELRKIGGFSAKSISLETIVALTPDLIIAEENAHDSLKDSFQRLGLRVLYINAVSYEDIFANILLIGSETGHIKEAEALVAELKSRLSGLEEKLASVTEGKTVFWEVWHDPLMTAGPETFIGQSIALAKGRNIFGDAETDWPQVSTEELIRRDPQVILSSNSHGGRRSVADIQNRQDWQSLSAIKNKSVYLLEDDLLARSGPRIIDGLEEIAMILYPDLF